MAGEMDSSYGALADGDGGSKGKREANGEGKVVWQEDWHVIGAGEAKKLWSLAWAILLTNLCKFSFTLVTVGFVGHLGELELSSASIANAFANVTGFSVMLGLGSALETLCGQAYGAKEYGLLGVHLQAAWMVSLSICIPIGILWWNLEVVLLWWGQDPQISKMAASYCVYTFPGLVSAALYQPLFRFLQAQSQVIPMLTCAMLAAIVHPFVCYGLIYSLGLGYTGGSLAYSFSNLLLFVLLASYTFLSGKCSQTWTGFRIPEAVCGIRMYVKLAIPSVMMVCLKQWSSEILLLLSGLLPNPTLELSLLSVALNTSSFLFMIPFGFSGAASTRVSNEVGANDPTAARTSAQVALCLVAVQAALVSTFLIIVRNVLGLAYTDVEELLVYFSEVMPLLSFITFVDALQGVLSGILRGCGRQRLGAMVNLGAFYGFGMPAAYVFGFLLHLNGKGLIIGLACGMGLQGGLLLYHVLRTDWHKMAAQAQTRVQHQPHDPQLPSYLERLQSS